MIKYIIIFGVVAGAAALIWWRSKKPTCPKIISINATVGLGDPKN